MANFFTKLFGDRNSRIVSALEGRARDITAHEEALRSLSDEDLKHKTVEFRDRLKKGEILDDILNEAFAVVREVSKRVLGQRHYDVQLMGGVVMHEGNIAEMRTGEGKTLAATAPVYLNALAGEGVHVITVNDYLARRDAAWMGQVYSFLGLKTSVINSGDTSYLYDGAFAPEGSEEDEERDESGYYKVVHDFLRPITRKEAYEVDITYGTNSEFGFDYLRDNLAYSESDLRQTKRPFAIIDEIDSVLIDEARTPLIISAPAEDSENLYAVFAGIARSFTEGEEYTKDEEKKAIQLTEKGIEKAEKALKIDNIYTDKAIKYVHHLETAVRAKALYESDKEYVVQEGNIVIVDQFTGRLMPTRRFSGGLHQALEAKEGVEVKKESKTYASITYQNFFRMYDKLAGMTGTAKTSEEEFLKVYGIDTVVIPTNKPIARLDQDDLIYQTVEGKFKAIADKVKELNDKGQPVLIGTVSIEKNELLSKFLDSRGVSHRILNAKNHEKEGEIVANAGKRGSVTIATNMAGRGVDIKLGGEGVSEEVSEEVKALGGLFVLGTERHEARRIDNQLRGRAGRQGDPGETQFFVSLEDDLMRVFAPERIKGMFGTFGIPEDQSIQNKMITRALENAQEKIEGLNFDRRKHVLSFDDVLNHQRQTIYARRSKALVSKDSYVIDEIERIIEDDEVMTSFISEKRSELGEDQLSSICRRVILQTIDMFWVEHLENMEHLRSRVSLQAYGQKDPLIEYKREGLYMFRDLEARIDEHIARVLKGLGEGAFEAEKKKLQEVHQKAESLSKKGASNGASGVEPAVTGHITDKEGEKIGRNDRVIIQKDGEERILKFKKAESLLKEGWSLIGRSD